ncbi:MAG TPA: (2Fe-2S)-binding protein [Albitalea sp.]|nr:(2Fe-2S)-binding protein [Albitalea sp.]
MIVCVCRRVSDRDIRQAVLDGARDFETLQMCTGVSTACGRCEAAARAALAQSCEAVACCSANDAPKVEATVVIDRRVA